MNASTKNLPIKKADIQNAIIDSTRWNTFQYRKDDVVIDTWAKSGTTWMQQIVSQLILGAPEDIRKMAEKSPWLEMRIAPLDETLAGLEKQKNRRFIKTHLPIDALVFSPEAKYIFVGRDARDVVWSAYNHQAMFTQDAMDMFNNTPGLVGPPLMHPPGDVRSSYLYFLENGELPGFPICNFWNHIQGWWDVSHRSNVLPVHFNNLKTDMEGEIRRIAEFLNISIDDELWPLIFEHCSFDFMRKESKNLELFEIMFSGGGKSFFHKGTNGRWKDTLSSEEIEKCDKVASQYLTKECAHWLKTGEL